MDKENIKHLKEFIKKQKEIEKNLKKDQVILRRLFTPDGHIMQEAVYMRQQIGSFWWTRSLASRTPQSATTCTCTEEPGTRDVKQRNYWGRIRVNEFGRVSLKATFAG
jgi:hypothetical protein